MPTPTTCANPLLLEWVKAWLDEARDRNSKGVQVYKKAYDSLKSCPLPFDHPSEAQQLHGFGPKLCDRLTEKMVKHCADNNLPMPEMPHNARRKNTAAVADGEDEDGESTAPKKKKAVKKAYVPQLRSGAYALIIALSSLDEGASVGITKLEIIELAQPHSDSSFSAPSDPGKFYTAWNSMKTLLEKDLVFEKGRPTRKYALTDEGWEVAHRIRKTLPAGQATLNRGAVLANPVAQQMSATNSDVFHDIDSEDDSQVQAVTKVSSAAPIIPAGRLITDESSLPTFSPLTIPPSAYTVELVLDVREIRATKDRDYMQNELLKRGVTPIMRALELGDVLWVAKLTDPLYHPFVSHEEREIVLDYIVERKRLDDLIGSIKDGRFHEQKFRLNKSGIKNVIYIIEEISLGASESFGRYDEAVESAIASMQVVNGYFVKKTQKMDDTIRYLARMTAMLQETYRNKELRVFPTNVLTTQNYQPLLTHMAKIDPTTSFHVTYQAFAGLNSKSEALTLRDVFLKMLMCTRGVTGEKALEIQKRWKTPRAFLEAFEAVGRDGVDVEQIKKRKRELVFEEMGSLVARRKIAKVLSGKIAEVWADV